MNFVFAAKVGLSMPIEIKIVIVTVVIILAMPMIAFFAVAKSSLSFLSFSSSADADSQLYQGPLSTTDTYDWGNCTYWAALLRQQANDPIPNNWGNANTWDDTAVAQGYLVDNTPTVGSIMQSDIESSLGHVAYVTAVDSDTGAWTISEMNVKGIDITDTATFTAAQAANFIFIHDKEVVR